MQGTLEDRVAALERRVEELSVQKAHVPGKYDWIQTIGIFSDNPGMLELFEDALKIREADRKKTRPRKKASERGKT